MTLIDGDKVITAQLYDDQHEEFTEKKMSIIDYVNAYTDEGVTTADDVLDKIRAEIEEKYEKYKYLFDTDFMGTKDLEWVLSVIDKYTGVSNTDARV